MTEGDTYTFKATPLDYGYVLNDNGQTYAKSGMKDVMYNVEKCLLDFQTFVSQHDVGEFEITINFKSSPKKQAK